MNRIVESKYINRNRKDLQGVTRNRKTRRKMKRSKNRNETDKRKNPMQ